MFILGTHSMTTVCTSIFFDCSSVFRFLTKTLQTDRQTQPLIKMRRGLLQLKCQGRPLQFWVRQKTESDKSLGHNLHYNFSIFAVKCHWNGSKWSFFWLFNPFWSNLSFLTVRYLGFFLIWAQFLPFFMTIYSPTSLTVRHQGRPWTPRTPLDIRPCL